MGKRELLWAAILAMLAACGASPTQNGAWAAVPPNAGSLLRLTHGASWMAGPAKEDLLYISDGNGEVTVYRYWQRKIVGLLTDFTQPMGECVDKSGDVFITDYAEQHIVEYRHGATKPIRTLNDAPYTPYACSVDFSTGNLAVANLNGGSSNEGNVAIYAHASGVPTYYTDSTLFNFEGCAYDSSGNLLVTNGQAGKSGASYFAWLPTNGHKLIDIKVPGPSPSWSWKAVAGIQWDGKYWAIDQAQGLYRITIINGQAYYVGSTGLQCYCATGPYWIYNNHPAQQGTQVVGAAGSEVDYWDYPSGYSLYGIYHGIDQPFAVTVSLKQN